MFSVRYSGHLFMSLSFMKCLGKKLKSIAKLFHTQIPYPVILLIKLGGEIAVSLADKRINQVDSSKLVIDNFFNSPWFNVASLQSNENDFLNDFSLRNVSSVNYYELYQDFISMLIALNTSDISGRYLTKSSHQKSVSINNLSSSLENQVNTSLFTEMSNEEKLNLLKQLALLESELSNIRNKLKKEMQMYEKMRLNVQARKVKQAISAITSQLL